MGRAIDQCLGLSHQLVAEVFEREAIDQVDEPVAVIAPLGPLVGGVIRSLGTQEDLEAEEAVQVLDGTHDGITRTRQAMSELLAMIAAIFRRPVAIERVLATASG